MKMGKKLKHTQLCQQLIDGLNDVGFEGGERLSEVLITDSSRCQKLVEGFLLVGLFAATSGSAEHHKANKLVKKRNCAFFVFFCRNSSPSFINAV